MVHCDRRINPALEVFEKSRGSAVMPITRSQVRAKAKAIADSLSKLTQAERQCEPSVEYVESYNQLLELAKEAVPDVDARLWPSTVPTSVRYAELLTYANQICALVPPSAGVITRR